MKKVAKILKFLLIFILIAAWLFSGYPPIWQNPRIPPEIQKTQAATTQKFYLHDAASPDTGTLPSAKLSAATASVTAANASTNRDMNNTIGASQVSQALTSLGQTTLQKHWFRRFLSRPLAAQTLPTGKWTLQLGASEDNGAGNESFNWSMSLFVWRPSTGKIVATTTDMAATSPSATASVVEAGTAETNLATTTPSIAGVAIQDGDILALEIWAHAVQGNTTARTDTVFYDGTTEGSTTSNAAFLNAPGAITLQTSLTFTVDTGSVSFVSTITPGTPVSTSSVLTVNTNNSTGYNIKINRASTTPTLILSADNATTIADTPSGNNWTAPAATSTAGPSAIWTVGTTRGLGFRVKQTGTVSNTYSSIWWGTDDTSANAKYSGISTSTALQMIANTTLGSATNENTAVEYKLDTAKTQKSGNYVSSPVVYTATVNP